jgi:predicted dehydrogenase/threonine dehydrogenase-like Zn-dependent dehydrogenase
VKQIIQNLKTGETILEEVPAPVVKSGQVLIKTTRTLVSLGTERMLVAFGKAGLISKARQQPDRVKQVLDKIKTEGLLPTLEAVFNKLNQPLPLGYCNVGEVIEVGKGVTEFAVGDRVASNGQHAEYVCIPKNLVAKIPDNVSDDEASFTVIGSIGLQSIRLLNPTLGETVVVFGLGLIGLITAELLKANGCRVIGIDLDADKLAIAQSKGITAINPATDDVIQKVHELTGGTGCDGVVITASAKTDAIISQSAQMSRKRGRIILVGVIGLNISRAEFYNKELSFQVSCSYGPGRYDEQYEQNGVDYPLPFVRWTEKRNFETILQAISLGSLNVKPLITEVVPLPDYNSIYGNMGSKKSIASIIRYPEKDNAAALQRVVPTLGADTTIKQGSIGIIGSGNFTKMTMMPALKKAGAHIKYISSAGGVSGTDLAKKYKIQSSTTDNNVLFNDPNLDLVIVTTRHNSHAHFVCEAVKANKHVFVEKPLAINREQLKVIVDTIQEQSFSKTINVGFNRRYSPHIQKMKQLLGANSQLNIIATMNAGFIPPEVWVHDMEIGGGRIVGEACHYLDLMVYLTGSKISSVCANALGTHPQDTTDNMSILVKFENGSNAVLNYMANGNKSYPKERLEVHSQGRTLIMDNFRVTEGFGFKGFSKLKTSIDKGHMNQFSGIVSSLKGGTIQHIPFAEIYNVSLAALAAIESLKNNTWINIEN